MHIPNPFRPFANLYRGLRLMATTSYEGASTTKRLRTWGLSSAGPNSTINDSLAHLKYRSRDLDRNNPNASGGIDSFVSTLIGRGLTPRWNTGNPDLDAKILDLWKLSVPELDASVCGLDFYGLQTLLTTSLTMSGGVLGMFRYYPSSSDLAVPIKIQLMENDHLYDCYDQDLENGNTLRLGIEITPSGERAAYHIYPEHPGDNYIYKSSLLPVRIPASEILHVYSPRRPGQLRGTPSLAPVITGLHNIDEYDDAERVRKKSAAMYAGFITTPTGDPALSGLPGLETEYGDDDDLVGLEPGILQELAPGQSIEWSKPADVGDTFEPWMAHQLRQVAKALHITYEQLTGDLRSVNYSSIRAGLVEIYRLCRARQAQIIVHKFCRPFTTRWLDIAVASGRIFIPRYYKYRKQITNNLWDPDGWDWVDPLKDLQSEILAIRAGIKSRSMSVGERGSNTAEIDSEISKDNTRTDSLGIILDSDPRQTTQSGGPREKPQTGGPANV
jgi:lambda family phage portal protein